MPLTISISDKAAKKAKEFANKDNLGDFGLRVGVKGGGCSGYMYSYEFIPEPISKDKIFEFGDVKICIDFKSYLFLNGMEIDYQEDLLKSGLIFNAPQASRTCGCGESVSF